MSGKSVKSSATIAPVAKKSSEISILSKIYLIAYNVAQVLG